MTESRTMTPGWSNVLRAPLVLTLSAALLAQLGIAVLLASQNASLAPAPGDVALLPMATDTLTAIEISDANATVKLARTGDGWVLPALGNFPASATRIEQLLTDLGALKRPLPIATTAAAQKRFKVTDAAPERRLTLRGPAGAETTLLLGDSPGFRRVFARPAGEDAVYELRLGIADLPARADDWLDRGKLALVRGRIERVAGPGWTLVKQGDTWTLDGQQERPTEAAVDEVLNALAALGYSGVLGTDAKPEYHLDNPALTLTVGLSGGAQHRYVIGQLGDGPESALKADDQPWYYRLADYDVAGLKEISLERLLGKQEKAADDGAAGGPAAAAPAPSVVEPAASVAPAAPAQPPEEPTSAVVPAESAQQPAEPAAPPADAASAPTPTAATTTAPPNPQPAQAPAE